MEIKFENLILRHMIESDIADCVRWFTTETEWSKTDAPWEPIESEEETEPFLKEADFRTVNRNNDCLDQQFDIQFKQ